MSSRHLVWKPSTRLWKDGEPTSWTLELPRIGTVTVTRHAHYPSDAWLLRTKLPDLDMVQLPRNTEGARVAAFEHVKLYFRQVTRVLEAL
tara:strand:+ start:2185 stop:2454 length:270 start_codon:yes stop_codon:yes gene_type:complete